MPVNIQLITAVKGLNRSNAILLTGGIAMAMGLTLRSQGPSLPQLSAGVSVAASSGMVFIAGSGETGGHRVRGTVHVFQRRSSNWERTQVLDVPESHVEDPFGIPLAVDGRTLVVGAQFADRTGIDSGLAYVFERLGDEWRQAAILVPEDAASGDQFGLTVSVSGGTIAVGARLADTHESDAGAAYLFERHGMEWRQVQKLVASDAKKGDLFGRVSVDGDLLVATADLNDERGENAGKAYAFVNRDGRWQESARMFAEDAAGGDELGVTVALKGGTAVLGAIGATGNALNSGAAYMFELRDGGWDQTARLVARDGIARQAFGNSVALDRDTVVVGAPGAGIEGRSTGAAYVFERVRGAWTPTATLVPREGTPGSHFGQSVGLRDGTIVVGQAGVVGRTGSGARVFERTAGQWRETAQLTLR